MLKAIAGWWRRQYRDPFTVAADLSMFWTPFNEREQLFHFKGLVRAQSFARRWVWLHPSGQARIIPGHATWPEETKGHANGKREDFPGQT